MIETRRETFETPDGSVPVFDWNDKTEIAIKKVLREGEHYPSMTVVYKMIGLDNLGVPNLDGGVQKNKAKKCLSMYARLEKVQKGKNEVCCYEIYPIPRFVVNPDGRGKNGIYIDRLIPIMLSLFNACTDSQIETTINKLAVNFSLVKAKYVN